jgi:hypothetical protein
MDNFGCGSKLQTELDEQEDKMIMDVIVGLIILPMLTALLVLGVALVG